MSDQSKNDALDLILFLARQQTSKVLVGDNVLVNVLETVSETITVTDSVPVLTMTAHPVKWDAPKWNIATWG